MNVDVNFLAVLLAGVASMIVGYLWYSPVLFAKPWMKLMGYSNMEAMKSDQKKMGKVYGVSFVASLVTAYVLTHIMAMSQNSFGYTALMSGLTSAFWAWLGFVAPVQLTDVLFGKGKLQLFAINTGYQLVALLVMGVVLGLL